MIKVRFRMRRRVQSNFADLIVGWASYHYSEKSFLRDQLLEPSGSLGSRGAVSPPHQPSPVYPL
jgi:hypothetical protein